MGTEAEQLKFFQEAYQYFYAAYSVFWLLPTLFVIRLYRQMGAMEKKVTELQGKIGIES